LHPITFYQVMNRDSTLKEHYLYPIVAEFCNMIYEYKKPISKKKIPIAFYGFIGLNIENARELK